MRSRAPSRRSAAPHAGARLACVRLVLAAAVVALSGCGTMSGRTTSDPSRSGGPAAPERGGYYLDDGPHASPPANLDQIPDATPRLEPLHRGTMRPYAVMGRSYTPMTELAPYRERGTATWYGRRYHGKPTSSGEPYDMYAMTAAHTVLPIPSYARVTNLANGRSVVVRINDRGPFIGERLIDLSYVAAHRLDIIRNGAATVEVETIVPESNMAAPNSFATAFAGPTAVSVDTRAQPESRAVRAPVESGGHYLQLAAFAVRENAERFIERVRAQLAELDTTLEIVPGANLFRIQSGPYASRAAAAVAAERITALTGTTPLFTGPR